MGIKGSGAELHFSALSLSSVCDRCLLNSDAAEQRYIQPDGFKAETDGNVDG